MKLNSEGFEDADWANSVVDQEILYWIPSHYENYQNLLCKSLPYQLGG